MDFLLHAGASVSITLISELVGCFMECMKNLEIVKTLLKILRLHNIVRKYPRMSFFTKEQTSWHGHGEILWYFNPEDHPYFQPQQQKESIDLSQSRFQEFGIENNVN